MINVHDQRIFLSSAAISSGMVSRGTRNSIASAIPARSRRKGMSLWVLAFDNRGVRLIMDGKRALARLVARFAAAGCTVCRTVAVLQQ